jgi:hypothetical protein
LRASFPALLFVAASCAPSPASEDCPAASSSYDDRIALIAAAPDCARAAEAMKACLFGVSGDVGLAEAVEAKCEPVFLKKLSPAERRNYAAAGAHCLAKYAHQEGTMYVSFAATCKAGVAVDYARRFGGR